MINMIYDIWHVYIMLKKKSCYVAFIYCDSCTSCGALFDYIYIYIYIHIYIYIFVIETISHTGPQKWMWKLMLESLKYYHYEGCRKLLTFYMLALLIKTAVYFISSIWNYMFSSKNLFIQPILQMFSHLSIWIILKVWRCIEL